MTTPDLRLLAGLALLLFGGLATYTAVGAEEALALLLAGACLALLALAAAYLGRKRLALLGQALHSLARTGSPGPRTPDELAEPLSALAQALRSAWEERDLLLAAFHASPDGLLVLDAQGRLHLANAAAASLLGQERGTLHAQPLTWFLPHEAVEALRRLRREGGTITLALEGPGGRALELTATGIGAKMMLVALRDLTEARRVDQMRRDFVANVSHELRTPLAALRSALETLRAGALDDPQACQFFLARAEAETQRLTRLVEELLELSRLEAGVGLRALAPVDMDQVLQRAVERMEPQARQAGLALTLRLPSSLPSVLGDAERLERVVVNLLDNAIKFTPPGGSVTVMASATQQGIVVAVQDTGIGIDERDLPRIFERFYKADRSRHQPGAGLGLAIVKHIVEAHGGRVWAESTPGQGSTFYFSLPASS